MGSDHSDYTKVPHHQSPNLCAWLGGLAALGTIAVAELLPRGGSGWLRIVGVALLPLAAPLLLLPLFFLRRYGQAGDRAGMRTRAVVDRGPYAVVRHPQYLGTILLACGFALVSQHALAGMLAVAGAALYYAQALQEERDCLSRLGPAYACYQRRVPRFNVVLGIARRLRRRWR